MGTMDSVSVTTPLTIRRSNQIHFCLRSGSADIDWSLCADSVVRDVGENLNRLYLQTIEIRRSRASVLQSG